MRAGVDTGGTFTDVVGDDGRIAKVLSTPDHPARAVGEGVDGLGGGRPAALAHGTTVATNTLLERDGAAVALVTNEGFADVIELARQTRPSLYDHFADRPEPLVPRDLRLEVPGRLAGDGRELEPVGEVPPIPAGVDAVAVCLLHSDLDPSHEQAVARTLRDRGVDVTASHEIAPEYREYERTSTVVVNAYVRPRCRDYLSRVGELAERVSVMTSAGGLLDAHEAAARPARLLLSGPAGGVRAAAAFAAACGAEAAVSFDMGGTSTDVCLIRGGVPEPAPQLEVGGLPVRLPSLDIHTIGAGGGSVAVIDAGGALVVGPRSSGAQPGPACYGQGGTEPTVTDADLLLGRIPAEASFASLSLDRAAAERACAEAGVDPQGVVDVVNAGMERALRTVTVEKGVDPREVALVAFGGAGPLHAADLAAALGIPRVIVPPRAGVLSAVGLLCAPEQRDLVRTWPGLHDLTGLDQARAEIATDAATLLDGGPEVTVDVAVDCRYRGQSHELTVPNVDDFPAEHDRRNGYTPGGGTIEVVALRATARRPAVVAVDDLPVPTHRASLDPVMGPAVIAEPDCTVWVPEGWRASSGPAGCLVLEPSE